MRALLLTALLLPGLALAASKPKGKDAAPPPAPAQEEAVVLRVTLKDGQALDARLQKYDAYFLSVANSQGTVFDLPWAEVASLESDGLSADLPLMLGRLTAGASPVSSLIEPRSGSKALAKALWPGLLLHGSGHRYAGDHDTFVSLVGAELFGVVVGGFGLGELLGPGRDGEHKDTATALAVAGGSVFVLTWLWDLAFSPGAARRHNQAKGLALEPTGQGLKLALTF